MKCEFPSGCDKELSADGFCSDHGNNKAWGPSYTLILLQEAVTAHDGDGVEYINKGIFSTLDKAIKALEREYNERSTSGVKKSVENIVDGEGRGRLTIRVTPYLGSAFEDCYHYETVGLDKLMD